LKVELLYLDDDLVAVDKPAGVLVHRTGLAPDRHTLLQAVRDRVGGRVYPVHRLDRGTSGVLLFARSPEVAGRVGLAFRQHQVEKVYLAAVRGWTDESGEVDYPVDPARSHRALTRYRTLDRVELPFAVGPYATARYSLVEARPLTGQRHQIRRHFKHLRHPVLGDREYGDRQHNRFLAQTFGLQRLCLVARRLVLAHPRTGQPLVLEAPLGRDLEGFLAALGFSASCL
jgi:tRNA pseudouridine65 synthase